ncbi:MAG TPA: sigma-70 family RNA polymerase sigma factor [Phycisphaerales bacterium]|jgi:RNA polymerase sigma factor (sigma-70 family)|nr:sigma-70 family RNA polymerase sigma factor [Phycisphaerales bacterium]|tara:strand:- start:175 stop:906 length:732 start_codon:yes stop_codon:yes gene_type:complete
MNALTTTFVRRLRDRDEAAWFELWQDFGPAIRFQLSKWGGGRIGIETVQDLTQDTLAALSTCIERYDPSRGARFSTWLLSIAKHTLGDEMDRRNAQKRNSGVKPLSLDERIDSSNVALEVDDIFEQRMFAAKICAAIRRTESEADFVQFQVWRMRALDNKTGKEVSEALGISEPTVSRYMTKVRDQLKQRIAEVVMQYSFTPEEEAEAQKASLSGSESVFDDSISNLYHSHQIFLGEEAGGRM